MTAILLILSMIAQVMQQVCRKEYDKRDNRQNWCFSLLGVLTTLLYFVFMSGGKFSFTKDMIFYAIPFSLCYTVAYICTMFAIKNGPLSLTSLIISCSIAVPVIYGVIALDEPFGLALMAGIITLFLSVLFVSEPFKRKNSQISLKWVFHISAVFLSNGICIIFQKLFQITDKGAHSNEFMILSLAITLITILIFVLIYERKQALPFLKNGVLWPVLCGVGNGMANQLTMMLAVTLPASFLYPVQSAGAIIITAIVSLIIYREKMSFSQKAGFIFGVLAIILFNI